MGRRAGDQEGQATLLVLGVLAALLAGLLVLVALGQAVGAHGTRQRAADLAAMSAAAAMRSAYPRLFEPAFLERGVPNPRHLSTAAYLALVRGAARRVAARNGAAPGRVVVHFPAGFAPTRVTVTVRGFATPRVPGRRERARVPVSARAVAELAPSSDATLAGPARASGGGYDGPLAYRMGKAMRPDVAAAFDRMAAAARSDGLTLSITSAFRSDAEQARLFAANPNPKWVVGGFWRVGFPSSSRCWRRRGPDAVVVAVGAGPAGRAGVGAGVRGGACGWLVGG